ncbi:MAG: hypothetical protein CO150_02325 [Nitrospirae bacterium CG_4_9_14_3_um_filter_53_35]|nr:MAG: hypothetical protein COT35_02105 [Nitrospirae bacterium CG08_land_8_20_14_0_20_52_24]PIV85799.1 MAG: hypothetical protein COW52_00325 [Nitrospirae bacterium CG17_big_fil_post_rev_8_21_14_2_50_50_9]PIW85303.1 MAG: hypothetical protein COZ95_05225 [Nitrospirae bacterium CG_4_8_14_3_um_filter_50_41]PIX85264.1 MAG: hypothetical protein COZ32_09375 [Nitrospirae bacterium CG_4_10_14_3_um_filter_53_41]PJA76914.1 MAG: hypothetical protein CO150_02325 [Nitrospirae bacterium CG_4_9_14_3_um_filter
MSESSQYNMDDQIAKNYILEVSPDINQEFASKKFREINILLKSNLISNLNMEFKVSLHVLCDLVLEMIHYDKALLYLWDNDLEVLTPYITRGFSENPPEKRMERNIFADWCIRHGKTLFIPFSSHPNVTRALEEVNSKSMISVPIYESNHIIGTLQLYSQQSNFFSREDAKLLWLLIIHSEALFRNYENLERIRTLSSTGMPFGQTHISEFHEQLEREIGRADRRKTPMSLLLIEVDRLPEYIRKFGHLKREEAFNEIGSLMMNQIRQIDAFSRYGEDRFALILTETDRKGGTIFANRLRENIGRHLIQDEKGEKTIRMTISSGLVTFPFDAKEKIHLLQAAEQALHKAIDAGGDQVCLYTELDSAIQSSPGHDQHEDLDRISQTIHSIFNLDLLLELVVQICMETLQAEKGSLLLFAEELDCFILRVACGFGKYTDLIKNTRVPLQGTITGWVAALKKPVVSANIEEISEVPKSLYKDYRNNSFLSVPLVSEDKTIGVVHLSNKRAEDGIFTNHDLERILSLSEHLTLFLKQGIRFEETQHRFSKTALLFLNRILEEKDPYNRDHSERVALYAEKLARRFNFSQKEIEKLTLSARLHDIGKIAIHDEIFHKPDKLSETETAIVRRLPFFSWKILDALSANEEELKNTVLKLHEKLDGSGYPYGLVGEQIPLPSRILSVADTFVSMTSNRSFRPPFSKEEALKNMNALANVHYDPEVLQQLNKIVQ